MADRKLGVVIVADASRFVAGLKSAGRQVQGLRGQIEELDVGVKASAETQVAAAVKSQARLREQVAAYRQIGAAAESGSREQISAANLASQAERRLSASLGVTAREAREFGASAARAESETGRASRGAIGGEGAFRGLGRSFAFAASWLIGGVGLEYGLKATIGAASDLQGEMQRTEAVFSTSAAGVKAWSNTSAQALGLSRAAALGAADTVGTLLENVGQTPAKAAAMSQSLVKLASDMGAFAKKDPSVALAALEAGLQGRTRSLKQFGLVIDNTSIKAQAIASGILKSNVDPGKVHDDLAKVSISSAKLGDATRKHGAGSIEAAQATVTLHNAQRQLAKDLAGSTGQLTAQQKALATYDLIMAQTTAQRGAFAKNSGELAIKEQIFHAALTNTEATIGTALLPTVTHYVGALGTWLSSSQNQARVQRDVTTAVHDLNVGIKLLEGGVRLGVTAFRDLAGAVGGSKNELVLLGGILAGFKVNKGLNAFANITSGARLASGEVGGLSTKLRLLQGIGTIGVTVAVTELILNRKSVANWFEKNVPGSKAVDKFVANDLPGGRKVLDTVYGKKFVNDEVGTGKSGKTVPQSVVAAAEVAAGLDPKKTSDEDALKNPKVVAYLRSWASKGKNVDTGLVVPRQTGTESNARKAAAAGVAASAAARRAAPRKIAPTTPVSYKTPTARTATYTDTATKPTKASSFEIPLALQIRAAKAATTSITTDDVAAARAIKAFTLAAIKSRHLQGQALLDAYNDITTENSIIGTQTKSAARAAKVVTAEQLTAGLGLSGARRKEAEARIAQAIAHGGHRPIGHTVLGQNLPPQKIQVFVDGTPMYEKTITHAQRQSRHHVTQSRGPNAGRGHPFT